MKLKCFKREVLLPKIYKLHVNGKHISLVRASLCSMLMKLENMLELYPMFVVLNYDRLRQKKSVIIIVDRIYKYIATNRCLKKNIQKYEPNK